MDISFPTVVKQHGKSLIISIPPDSNKILGAEKGSKVQVNIGLIQRIVHEEE